MSESQTQPQGDNRRKSCVCSVWGREVGSEVRGCDWSPQFFSRHCRYKRRITEQEISTVGTEIKALAKS